MIKSLLLSFSMLASFAGFSQCQGYFLDTPLAFDDTLGDCSGEVYNNFIGGTAPFECYMIFQSDTMMTMTLTSPDVIVSGLCEGLYIMDVVDANGCQDTATFYINGPCSYSGFTASSAVTAPTGPGVCNGSIAVTPTGGTAPYTYSFAGAPFSGIGTVTNFCPGPYNFVVMDAAGCTLSLGDVVPEGPCWNSTLTASVTGTDPSSPAACDGTMTVTVSGGMSPYAFSWSNGTTAAVQQNLCDGFYTVTVVDANGCMAAASDSIGYADPCAGFTVSGSVQNSSAAGICDGSITVAASGGAGATAYLWDNGMTTQTIGALCPGVYTIMASDANGCNATASFTVTGPGIGNGPLSGVVSTTNASANGECDGTATVTVTGGTAPYQIWQSNGTNGAAAGNLCEGYYSVTVVDANNDTLYLDYIIVDPTNLIVNTPYPDSTVIDSLAGTVVGLCSIAFSDVTASYAVSYSYPSPDSVAVIWAIETISSGTITLTMSYAVDSVPGGVYSVALSVYCPQKSGPQFLQVYDQLYIGELSLAELGQTELTAFPNPFTESLEFSVPQSGAYTIALIDVTGRTVRSETVLIDGSHTLNGLSQLAAGRYLLQVSSDGYHAVTKVVK